MTILAKLLGLRPALKRCAEKAHERILKQSRKPVFYLSGAAEDTVEGRFEMVVLHASLGMKRAREIGPDGHALAQAVFEILFSNVDHALRETGTGDLRVGRKMRLMGEVFYGQARALDSALCDDEPRSALVAFFSRNGPDRSQEVNRRLADYALAAWGGLAELSDGAVLKGEFEFPDPSTMDISNSEFTGKTGDAG